MLNFILQGLKNQINVVLKKVMALLQNAVSLPCDFSVDLLLKLDQHWCQHAQSGSSSGHLQHGQNDVLLVLSTNLGTVL